MNKFLLAVVMLGVVALGFTAGSLWQKKRFKAMPQFEVKQQLALQVNPASVGALPAGVILYEYRVLPEISTYIMFVNLKERDVLAPVGPSASGGFVITPVDAYSKGE